VGLAFGILEETLGGQRAGLGLGVRIVQLVFDFAIFLPTLAVGIGGCTTRVSADGGFYWVG
jgi:hypothetical protein